MKSLDMKRALWNLVLIAVVVPVSWLGLLWLLGRLMSGPSHNPWEGSAFVLNVLTLAPQMVLAGIVQQIPLMLMAPRLSNRGPMRLAAIILALVVVPLVLVALQGGAGIIAAAPVALALAAAVAVYGLLMRLPLRY